MRIIARRTLREHWDSPGRSDSMAPLVDWYNIVQRSDWPGPAAVKEQFRAVSFVGEKVVFNIGGNKYRLIVAIDYPRRTVYVKWLGTHREYDRIDVGSM